MEKNYLASKTWLALILCCLPFLAFSQQIQWATFIDASAKTSSQSIRSENLKLGPDGYVYVIGAGYNLAFQGPITPDTVITYGAIDGSILNPDIFLLKMSPNGNQILWACIIGGKDYEDPNWFDFDASGNIIIGGQTDSYGFPITANAHQPFLGGAIDLFFLKLSANGELLYSSYLGGIEDEFQNNGFVSADGSIFFDGLAATVPWPPTGVPTFPTKPGAYNPTGTFSFGDDYFIGRLNADMSFFQGTYLSPQSANNYREGYLLGETPEGNLVINGSVSSGYESEIPTTPGAAVESSDPNAGRNFYMIMSRDLSTNLYTTADLSGSFSWLSPQFVKDNGNIVVRCDVDPAHVPYFALSPNSAFPFKTDGSATTVFAELTADLSAIVNTKVVADNLSTIYVSGEDNRGNYIVGNYINNTLNVPFTTPDAALPSKPLGSEQYRYALGVVDSTFSDALHLSYNVRGNSVYDEQNCTWYVVADAHCSAFFGGIVTSDTAYDANGTPLTGYWLGDMTTAYACGSVSRSELYVAAINFPPIASGNIISTPSSSYCINSIPEVLDGDEPVVLLPSLKIGYNNFEQNFNLHYQWQMSTSGASGPFSDIAGAIEEDYEPKALTVAGNRWYRRIARAGNIAAFPNCVQSDTSNVVEVITLSNISHSTDIPSDAYGLCLGNPINVSTTLTASPDGAFGPYNWTLSDISVDTVVLSGSTGAGSFSANGVPAAGLYQLEVSDTRGCVSADTLTVENMVIDAGPATVFTCDNPSLVIGPSGPAPQWENYATNSYSWLPTSNLNNAALLKPTVSPVPASGDSITYSIYVNGCLSDSVKVKNESITPLPALPADTICQGDSLNMGAGITPQAGVVYQWVPGFIL